MAGGDAVEVELPAGATIGTLRQALLQQAPSLASLSRHMLFAIGTDYADDAHTLDDGSEVACIPPVSGG